MKQEHKIMAYTWLIHVSFFGHQIDVNRMFSSDYQIYVL